MNKEMVIFTTNENGTDKLFLVMAGKRQCVLVCSSMASAIKLGRMLGEKFRVKLQALGVEFDESKGVEAGLDAIAALSNHQYEILREGTPEFTSLVDHLGL